MGNSETAANALRSQGLGKVVARRWGILTLEFCILSCMAFSAALWGQAGDSNASSPGPDQAAPAASSQQPDSAAKTAHADDTYIIGDDDILSISVWKDLDLTKVLPVRSDGRISLPLVGEMMAAGRTPAQLEQDLTAALRGYITDPQVTVIVQEIRSRKFNILGQVAKPGSYPLTADTTILDAIALAGGFKDFAKKKGVYVIRLGADGSETRIPFNYENFIKAKNKGKNTAQNIKLIPHDTIVVP
jgi:polysaccharide export outer membrane protein